TAYNMPQFIPLKEEPPVEMLEETFMKLIDRHESLRTSFHMIDGQPVQRVHDNVAFEIDYSSIHKFRDEHGLTRINTGIFGGFVRPFDLSYAPLLRVGLAETNEGTHILMMDMHHIISDGVSRQVLIKDFTALYDGEFLPPLRLQYKDFSQCQNSANEKEKMKQQETYWLNELDGEIPRLQLPIDYPRPAVQNFEGSRFDFRLSVEESRDLRAVALETGSTLFMVLLVLTNILLSKLSGQEDIVIGTPVAGRRHADLEKIIGMFVNTLALRNYPVGRKTVKEFIEEVKKRILSTFENQEYPFEVLVEQMDVQRDVERNPLFDVMFSLVDGESGSPAPVVKENNEITEISPGYNRRISKFDLSLGVVTGEILTVSFEYCTALFKKETIQRFIGYFKEIVHVVTGDIEVEMSAIEILSGKEKKQLLDDFNNTVSDYSKDKSVHLLFQKQAEKSPHHVAVKFENNNVTYSELNRRANHLAVRLRDKGILPDSIVTIMLDRCAEMLTGMMGILKAGGAYLPIDLEYPESRIQYILEDSRSTLVLVNRHLPDHLEDKIPMELLDLDESFVFEGNASNPDRINGMENLAYVIYTSGSSGKPKGVMVEHRNVTAFLHSYSRVMEFYPNDIMIQQSSYSFDAFVEEVYPILLKGGRITIAKNHEVIDPDLFSRFILKHNITLTVCAPQLLNEYNKWVGEHNQTPLRLMSSGGDVLKPGFIDNLLKVGTVYNAYGPTETTVCITYYKCPGELGSTVPIGTPIANIRVHILDRYKRLSPIGVAGELCISGDGVTRGYLNRPELTKEKFEVEAHFALYHTGDLARWLSDGNIEFLGRIDHQVKIRGYRIELGEIENRLLKHPEVIETVVVTRKDKSGDKYICAYVVPLDGHIIPVSGDIISGEKLGISNLRDYLLKNVPDYMMPSYFVEIDHVPLTSNGKVDRKALPAPELKTGSGYIAPGSDVEMQLSRLWSDALSIDKSIIGIDSNFFELGGHSLKATILVSQVHKVLNVKVPLTEVFRTPTIRGMAKYIHAAARERYTAINPIEKREYYAQSSAQKRLYILNRIDLESTTYNMPQFIPLPQTPSVEKLEETFIKLINRHESLRTSFHMIDNQPVQRVHDHVAFGIDYFSSHKFRDEHGLTRINTEIIGDFVRPFDLSRAPLLRAGLAKTSEDRHILMVDMHHIISDGISMEVLEMDFSELYEGKALPPMRIQYKDFAQWQNSPFEIENTRYQESYWLEQFEGEIPVLQLPTDYPRPIVQRFEGGSLEFQLSVEDSRGLRSAAMETGSTLFMVLLSLTTVLLSKLSGQEDIVVGTPIAGRRHADLEKIIGMFVNTLSLRNYPWGEKTAEEFLHQVKKRALKAFENQEYQFENLVEQLPIDHNPGRNPLFDVMFSLHAMGQGVTANSTRNNLPVDTTNRMDNAETGIRDYNYERRNSKFDLP
ncbi:MAG: amino acid adenylation domain-containing protein, partial [bacterium]|nr:amino acid adenylation domain-containing protein [bacterium]